MRTRSTKFGHGALRPETCCMLGKKGIAFTFRAVFHVDLVKGTPLIVMKLSSFRSRSAHMIKFRSQVSTS